MFKSVAAIASAGLLTIIPLAAQAQTGGAPPPDAQKAQPAPETPAAPAAPAEPEKWKGPFGGALSATFAVTSDYSYRGLSQNQRQPAVQVGVGYETPQAAPNIPVSAYLGAWGSNISFAPNTSGASVEVDLVAGLRARFLDDKLSFDLGYTRYNYPGANAGTFFDFNEYALLAGYDFGFAAVSAAVRYSPDFFANSGIAWYKWGQLTVPLSFIKLNDDFSLKLFGTLGNQWVGRPASYGIPHNDYWDWQVGITLSAYGFDLTAAYVDTNIDSPQCGFTQNCAARGIVSLTKTF